MLGTYIVRCGGPLGVAIASLDNADGNWWLRRINVPERLRGQGIGSHLLRLVLDDADHERVSLRLQVFSSGHLTDRQLTEWYDRYGFMALPMDDYTLLRPPRDL